MKRKAHIFAGKFLYFTFFPLLRIYFSTSKNIRAYGVLEHKGKVLIVKNWIGSGHWSFPGGGGHDGEAHEDTLKRELHEEVGINIDKKHVKLLLKGVKNRRLGTKKYVIFHINQLEKPSIFVNNLEIVDTKWVDKKDLLNAQPDSEEFQQVAKLLR